jgi:hypothetical protein
MTQRTVQERERLAYITNHPCAPLLGLILDLEAERATVYRQLCLVEEDFPDARAMLKRVESTTDEMDKKAHS